MPRYNVKVTTNDGHHHECEVDCEGDHADAISEGRRMLSITGDCKFQTAEMIYALPEPEPLPPEVAASEPEPEDPATPDPAPLEPVVILQPDEDQEPPTEA